MGYLEFRRTRNRLLKAGFKVLDSGYSYWAVGGWFIEIEGYNLPRQRIAWDGRDRWVYIEFFGSDGNWWDKATLKQKGQQSAEEVVSQALAAIPPGMESQRQREQAEYQAKGIREGWIIPR